MAPLFKKMAGVLADVHRVQKNGHNTFFKYDYATESDLVDVLRPALAKAGVAIFVNVVDIETRPLDITRVTLDITFACGESGETWTVRWYGDGQDKGDKGLYKAYTGALKYALMKTFLVSTGDDPEGDAEAPKPSPRAAQPQQAQTTAPRAEPTVPAQPVARPQPAPRTGQAPSRPMTPTARPQRATANGTAESATADQIRAIFAIGKTQGIAENRIRGIAFERFKVEHLHSLTRRQASELIDALQNTQPLPLATPPAEHPEFDEPDEAF
jgi:hypothetical protein